MNSDLYCTTAVAVSTFQSKPLASVCGLTVNSTSSYLIIYVLASVLCALVTPPAVVPTEEFRVESAEPVVVATVEE